jgi:hypothetical protein
MTRGNSRPEAPPAAEAPREIVDVAGQMPLPFAGKADVGIGTARAPRRSGKNAPKVESAAAWFAAHPTALAAWKCDWCGGRPVAWFVGERTVCTACASARGHLEGTT